MVINKSLKAALFKLAARFHYLNWLFFTIIAFGIVSWTTNLPLNLKSSPWLYIPMALIGFLSFFAWLLVWGWYSVWFRYLAYGVAHVISVIRRFFNNIVTQILIILGLSAWLWVLRKRWLHEERALDFQNILRLTSALKILVITAVLFTLWQLIKSRKRIVICDFENFTDDEKLAPVVKGIASRCSNEISRLSKLLKTYDEIYPDQKSDMAKLYTNLDVQDIGKELEEIIGPDSSIKMGNVLTIPIRPFYGFFRKLFHGPMIAGSVHLKGEKLLLTASFKGGKFKGNWQISFDENDTFPNSISEQLNKLTERLVCRMLTDLSQEITTPRWKAMQHFTEGLRLYRETLRTKEKRTLNLIKSKNAFSCAVRDDEEFVQCYFNFGIIYRDLKNYEAAKTAFRKALEKKPDYHQCCYQLAIIYYVSYLNEREKGVEGLFDAQWFCQQAIKICPTNPFYWDLLAVIQYYSRGEKVEDEVINSSMTGTMLAWRALCKSINKGEKTSKYKDTALICTRNLAVLIGLRKVKRGNCLFGQAIYLDPDNNDLHFEAGQYYYRMNDMPNAYKVFKRVFEDDEEVNDPSSYWALYINVNAQLCEQEKDEKKKKEYEAVVDNGYIHFLDAAAEVIHLDKNHVSEEIPANEELISEAFNFIKEKKEYDQNGLIYDLKDILKDEPDNIDFDSWIKGINKKISIYKDKVPRDFFIWMKTQRDVKLAISISQGKKKYKKNCYMYAVSKLNSAIKKLKDKYPNELKILGLHRYLAKAYLLLGSNEEALYSAREAARYAPYDPEVREILGKVYFNLKDYRQAIHELQICFNIGEPTIDILEKIGDAYIKEGELLSDPDMRKKSFTKAADFFKECHVIIEDKSYNNDMEKEDDRYIEILSRTHFKLALFYYELLKYDDALSHFKTALEAAIALERNDRIVDILLRMGWIYMDIQSFHEAEKSFRNAEPYTVYPLLTKTELDIGLMFSKVERTISIGKNVLSEENELQKLQKHIKAKLDSFQKIQEKEPQEKESEEKAAQLSALYHECLGRLYWKQGKMDDVEKEFETSISFLPNPRVYLYLAEFYLNEASESRMGRKPSLLAKARNACKLCRKTDLRQQYGNELADLEKKLDTPGM